MLIKNICKNMKIVKKNKNMIRGIHYFSTELKTKIDVIPRSCFKLDILIQCKNPDDENVWNLLLKCTKGYNYASSIKKNENEMNIFFYLFNFNTIVYSFQKVYKLPF